MSGKDNLKRKEWQKVVLILVYAICINSELSKEWPIFVISTLGMAVIFEHWDILKIICAFETLSCRPSSFRF